MIDKIADIQTENTVISCEVKSPIYFAKYPNKEPIRGKNKIAYSI